MAKKKRRSRARRQSEDTSSRRVPFFMLEDDCGLGGDIETPTDQILMDEDDLEPDEWDDDE